jgi:hypothetical protein
VTGWELPAIAIAGIALILGLVWIFAGRWVSSSKSGATAKDDLAESAAVLAEKDRIMGEMAKPVPRGAKLLELIRKRRERAEPPE